MYNVHLQPVAVRHLADARVSSRIGGRSDRSNIHAVCMYACKVSAAPAHAHTRAHRPGATPELRRVADTTSHGLSAGRHSDGTGATSTPKRYRLELMSKPGGGNVTDRESNPRPLGCMSGDSTTRLKRSAVMSGTGIHRLIYRDICVERGASYGPAAHNSSTQPGLTQPTHSLGARTGWNPRPTHSVNGGGGL